MAALELGAGRVLVASDMLLDGVHFDTRRHDWRAIGRKAMACNLSDCAAMAVRPVAATVSIAVPAEMTLDDVKEIFGGMFAAADEFDLAIVGGDTTSWGHPLAIDVAIQAEPYGGIEPVTRSGARPGDALFVTGPLGGSLLGRHLTFQPRVAEARVIAETLGSRLRALMDISDGLALDLWRMAQASNAGAMLDEGQLEAVTSDDARQAASADGRSVLDHVLADGEDFELLLAVVCGRSRSSTCPTGPAVVRGRSRASTCPTGLLAVAGDVDVPGVALHPVGVVTESGLSLRRADGQVERLDPKGWVH